MQLNHLFDALWRADLMRSVDPSAAGDGRLFAQGTATLTGRLSGVAQWSNSPRLHGDYAFPEARGIVDVDGGFVMFTLGGMSNLSTGRGVHVMTFMTEVKTHLWLNEVIAVGEGSIDPDAGVLAMRYYECVVDHLPSLPATAG